MKPIAVITTVGSLHDARAMARALVERKIAACAQISDIQSFYVWEGELQDEKEYRLLFKTTSSRYAVVEAAIREMHPYKLPAIHSYSFEHVHAPYGAWIEASSSG